MDAVLRALLVLVGSAALLLTTACGTSTFDPATPEGKRAIIEATNRHLAAKNCSNAIATIKDLYHSASTDNEVRMIMASAYACGANVNFFKLLGDLQLNAAYLGGQTFWAVMAKLFPATNAADDKTVESALLATDALMAALKPGAVILPSQYINPTSFNPGATVYTDRIEDSNIYLLFVSLAAIGAMENRFAAPDPTLGYMKTTDLPWTMPDSAGMKTDGCAFASELLNFADSLGGVISSAKGALKESFSSMSAVQQLLYQTCEAGCSVPNPGPCNLGCTACPTALRDRSKCAGTLTDEASCSAAALVNSINASWEPIVP